MQLWLFASPVVYPATVIPEKWRPLYALVNPAAGWLDSMRRVLTVGELPDPTLLVPSLVSTVVLAYVGCGCSAASSPTSRTWCERGRRRRFEHVSKRYVRGDAQYTSLRGQLAGLAAAASPPALPARARGRQFTSSTARASRSSAPTAPARRPR